MVTRYINSKKGMILIPLCLAIGQLLLLPFWASAETDDIYLETIPSWHSNDMDGRMRLVVGDLNGDRYPEIYSACRPDTGMNGQDRIYLNTSGQLGQEPMWVQSPVLVCYGADMADVDLDGDLDVAVADSNGGGYYRNDSGSLSQETTWQSAYHGATKDVAWGWVSQDGYADLITANDQSEPQGPASAFYRNTMGPLAVLPSWIVTARRDFCCAWGDIDNDGDMDACIGTYQDHDRIYRSQNGVLEEWAHWTSYLSDATLSVAFSDIDADGWLDLVEGTEQAPVRIYFNLGNGIFETSPSWSSTISTTTWQLALGDVDNDGDIDLACGTENPSDGDIIFENTGSGLNPAPIWSSALATSTTGIALVDIDLDGDLDMVTACWGSYLYRYENLIQATNAAPSPPTVLNADVDSNLVTLGWNDGSDIQTPTILLTYNLRVGTASGLADIVYAEIGPGNTHPSFGRLWHVLTKTLRNLPAGTYYWSVQTVDTGFRGSEWATEQSFVVTGSSVAQGENHLPTEYGLKPLYPNPFNPMVLVSASLPRSSVGSLAVYNLLGQKVNTLVDGQFAAGNQVISWNGRDDSGNPVANGLYFFVLRTELGVSIQKGILLR